MTKKPSYRFVGYTEPWEDSKLGECTKISAGGDIEKSKLLNNGKYPVIANALTNDGIVGYYNDSYRIDAPAVTVTGRGDIGVAKARNVNFTPVVRLLSLKSEHDVIFLENAINIQNIVIESTGVPQLTAPQLGRYRISFPSLPEQTAIGSFFQDIDQLISLQQCKLEVLKEQKKTYLKLLFPAKGQTKPALRFAGFEDDWKEVKLGEVLKKNNKKNRDLAINNVESVSNKLGFVKQTEQFEDYAVASADLSNYYVISEKQFAYNPSRINVGSIAYKKEGDTLSVVSPLYISFSTVENIDDSYLWYWFKTSLFDSQREIYSEGGVRDTLSFNQLSNIELIFPCFSEQEAIGSFFQDLDKAIAKQEEKVNQLKESKQTLLRKMFI